MIQSERPSPLAESIRILADLITERSAQRKEKALKTRSQYAFGSNLPLLAEFGFVQIPSTADFNFSTFSTYLEKQRGLQFEKLRKLSECLANAKYLELLVSKNLVTTHLSPPQDKSTINHGENPLPDNYKAPATLEITFKYSDALYAAALSVGFSKKEIATINGNTDNDDIPVIMAPENFRRLNRCEDTRLMFAFALSEDDYLKASVRGANTFFSKEIQKFAGRIAHAETINVVAHGWTGRWKMAVTQDNDRETSLVEAFFADLTPEQQTKSVCISMDGVGMGDNKYTDAVTVQEGFSPSDYAIVWMDILNSLGIFQNNNETKTRYIFTGHSMGGGLLAHILESCQNRLEKCERASEFLFELYNPAIIYDGISTHRWADTSATDELVEKIAAFMVSKGALGFGQAKGILKKLYELPEEAIVQILTQNVLLTEESKYLTQLIAEHMENVRNRTFASTVSALGSKYDNSIDSQILRNICQTSDKIKMVIVSADREKMVSPPKIPGIPVVMLKGGHYAGKRRDQQHITFAVRNFYSHHTGDDIRTMVALAKKYHTFRKIHPNKSYLDFQQTVEFREIVVDVNSIQLLRKLNTFVENFGKYFDFTP